MATKDIKVGNFYHVLVKVLRIDPKNGEITTETANEFGTSLNMEPTYFARSEKEAFFPITPENGIKNSEPAPKHSEPAPKHDPCRLFKKGDRIRFKTWHGFQPEDWENEAELLGKEATVYEDQKPDDFSVHFLFDGEDPDEEWHATYLPFIELVTPVEELEPYSVHETNYLYRVMQSVDGGEQVVCEYRKNTHPHAKEAAEAERNRLNAEYRKERE